MTAPSDLFDLAHCAHRELFDGISHAWEVLPRLAAYLEERLAPAFEGERLGHPFIGQRVYVGAGTVVEHGAVIKGPAWIGAQCQVRSGAYLRENTILGDRVVAGNSSEFKNCLVFDGCEVPHFNYVGDSVLGHRAHLGAGVVLSNVKLTRDTIHIRTPDNRDIDTGLRKFGALIGDFTQIGCHAVLNPGSILGPRCLVYPGAVWRGTLPADHIVKQSAPQQIVHRARRIHP